jgi:asparagine synthase (glutamine-hydrolysing)
MTLIAGILSRNDRPIPDSASESLRQSISRQGEDQVSVFKDDRSYFVKVDIGAFHEPGLFAESNGALSMLAGEPLLTLDTDASCQSRQLDLELIHEGFMRGDWKILRRAEGTFCAANYQPDSATLYLIADKLGIRPLYYWANEDYFAFASALRILENLPLIARQIDLRAVTEIVALGAPLGARTPCENISVLKSAEILQVTDRKISRHCYWRWDEIEPSRSLERTHLKEVYERFQTAVARRVGKNRTTVAYLSGGLDSRCVVAALVDHGVRVHTFNFARPGTQDQIFGNSFAREIGTVHEAIPKEAGDHVPDYSSLLSGAWRATRDRLNEPATRSLVAWSGEGGSVLLGHVHMNQTIVELMRAGKIDGAIEEYNQQEYVHISSKLLKPKTFKTVAGLLKEGVRAELNALHSSDAARNFYLFLMLNDQRRKLCGHFENIDLHRVEFQLPFFDSAFLTSVIKVPVELCLLHKLYTKWLEYFRPAVTSVPWQVYPGHEPCPLPTPLNLIYQWDEKHQPAERASEKKQVMKQAAELLSASDFPDEILSKRNLRLAAWIHSIGWRDYQHIIKAARIYHTYWRAYQ